jgi:hypothetical protein
MKNYLWTPLLAVVLLFAGCAGPLDEGGTERSSGLSGSGLGIARVSMGSRGARTLQPDASVLEELRYSLRFSAENKAEVTPDLLTGTSADVELEPGTWSLDVKGYVSEEEATDPDNAVVEGTVTVTVESGAVSPVTVALIAKTETESGAGTLVYDIRFPANAESAVLSITPISPPGNRQERDLKAAATSEGDVWWAEIEMDNLPAGYYRLGLEVSVYDTEESRIRTARKTIVAHIYNGLTTRAEETLGPEDFWNTPVFTDIAAMSAWLEAAEKNTKDTPYQIVLRGLDVETDFAEGDDPLGKLYNALNGKYVTLDLGGCAGATTGNVTPAIARARKYRDKIVSLVLPAALKTLGAHAFYECVSLLSLDWPFSAEGASIGSFAFSGCVFLVSVNLPEGLETIGESAFQHCGFLREISLPTGLQEIGKGAFANCIFLRIVSLPAGLSQIGEEAFQYCSSLRELSLPAGLQQIGDRAFNSCSSLRELSLPVGLQQIGVGAFAGCSSLREISLPAGLQQIGSSAFTSCSSLEQVTLPVSLQQIGNSAFQGCSSLEQVTLPAGLQQIGTYIFRNCTSLRWVKWPVSDSDVTGSGTTGSAFMGCIQLEKVELPDRLQTIRANSFANCPALEVVVLHGTTPPALSNINAFPTGNSGLTFYVPDAAVNTYQDANNWNNAVYKDKIAAISTLAEENKPANW